MFPILTGTKPHVHLWIKYGTLNIKDNASFWKIEDVISVYVMHSCNRQFLFIKLLLIMKFEFIMTPHTHTHTHTHTLPKNYLFQWVLDPWKCSVLHAKHTSEVRRQLEKKMTKVRLTLWTTSMNYIIWIFFSKIYW